MSLVSVINEPLKTKRYKLLSDYLKKNEVGNLNEEDKEIFFLLFEKYYTPTKQEEKITKNDIFNISISYDKVKNKCFLINNNIPASIKKLSGSVVNNKQLLKRALRFSINHQIIEFRKKNPLNINSLCPILNIPLGKDAEVDHIIPFKILSNKWIQKTIDEYIKFNEEDIKFYYSYNDYNYILEEPFYSSWNKYHYKKAKLRYVSKAGNRVAHKI